MNMTQEQWMDLKQAVSLRDVDWMESILHQVEMRRLTQVLDQHWGDSK